MGSVLVLGLLVALLSVGVTTWAQKKPSPPPSNPAIVFVEQKSWGHTNLMVVDADGANEKILINGVSGAGYGNHDPCWSPDGTSIAFGRTDGGVAPQENGIYRINKDGSGLCRIVPTVQVPCWGLGGVPRWSPVTGLIFYSDGAPYFVDGRTCPGGTVYSAPSFLWASMSWDPSGTRFATVIDNPSGSEFLDLFLYDLAYDPAQGWVATFVKNLTEFGPLADASLGEIDWANTSDRIVVSAALGSEPADIWVIDLDNPYAPTNITNTPDKSEGDPSWSPTDTQIAYLLNNAIYVMNSDGNNSKRIAPVKPTNLAVRAPDWRPR